MIAAAQKIVFSLKLPIINEFKKHVPARKRSEVIEALIVQYISREKERAAWEATNELRNLYSKDKDPVQLGAVEWLRHDRASH